MSRDTTLQIQVKRVKDGPLSLTGELLPAVFELDPDDEQISAPDPLRYDLTAALVSDGLLVQGQVQTTFRCRCDRCLAYFDLPLVNGEVVHYVESPLPDTLDLTPRVREDILINLPQKYLCREDCRGLCPNCGQNLNVRQCGCEPPESEPGVWGQLDGLSL